MKVVYSGPMPLRYHSTPSNYDYIFDPGVAQEVKKEDEDFFKCMSMHEQSPWQCIGLIHEVEKKVDAVVAKIKSKGGRK